MDASWGQQTAHPAMFQQQGQPTHAQALLEQHHRAAAQQAAQQQSQRQTMAALSAQPPSWGMPQQSTSAQMANPAPGATSQGQQPWGMTMPQQGTSAQTAQTASHAMFGAMQAQQASATHSLMAQQGAMPHHLPTQSAQPSGQQLFPQASHFPTPSPTANPLANLFAQQQHTTPTFSMPSTTSNPQSNTTAEALSLTHLAQNMDPTARKQLIQLLASHEPSLTPVGGSATAALQHLQQSQQSQQSQPPLQPPSRNSQLPQTQTHVPTATTDTTAVDAPRSEQKAPPSTRIYIQSESPQRKQHHSRRSHTQRRRSRVTQVPCAQTSTPAPTKKQYFVQKTQQASTTAFTQIWSQTTIISTIEIHQTQQARGPLPAIKACHVEKQISTRPFYSRATRKE